MLSRPVVFDASVLLNLSATGQSVELIHSVGSQGLICSAVADETLYIRSEHPDDPPEAIDLQLLLTAHVLEPCNLKGPEEHALFVRYAMDLDDGEAMSLALCSARGYVIATDDRKAHRIASLSRVDVIDTPEIVHGWVTVENPAAQRVQEVLRRIEVSARFQPSLQHPLRAWWDKMALR